MSNYFPTPRHEYPDAGDVEDGIEYRNIEVEGEKYFTLHKAKIVEIGYECGFDADEALRIYFERINNDGLMTYELYVLSNHPAFLDVLTTSVEKAFEKER